MATVCDAPVSQSGASCDQPNRLPLDRYRVVATRDITTARLGLSRHLWSQELRVASRADRWGLHALLHRAAIGPATLAYLTYGLADVSVTWYAIPRDPGILVCLPLTGAVEAWLGREHITVADTTAMVVQPGAMTLTRWTPGAAMLLVKLPSWLLNVSLGHMVGRPTRCVPVFAFEQPALDAWGHLVHAVRRAIDTSGKIDHAVAGWHTAQALATGLLTVARHDHIAQVYGSSVGLSPDLRRAVAWVQAHVSEPIVVQDLVRAAGTPERTLRRLWAKHLGMPPHVWIRHVRMAAAREALLAADPDRETVAGVISRLNFYDQRQFAVAYQQLYGERPVDTLRTRGHAANPWTPLSVDTPVDTYASRPPLMDERR